MLWKCSARILGIDTSQNSRFNYPKYGSRSAFGGYLKFNGRSKRLWNLRFYYHRLIANIWYQNYLLSKQWSSPTRATRPTRTTLRTPSLPGQIMMTNKTEANLQILTAMGIKISPHYQATRANWQLSRLTSLNWKCRLMTLTDQTQHQMIDALVGSFRSPRFLWPLLLWLCWSISIGLKSKTNKQTFEFNIDIHANQGLTVLHLLR